MKRTVSLYIKAADICPVGHYVITHDLDTGMPKIIGQGKYHGTYKKAMTESPVQCE
jgi:hypothetical protein